MNRNVAGDNMAAFIESLRRRLPDRGEGVPLPNDPGEGARQVHQDADLVDRFTQAAIAAGCEVHQTGAAKWIEPVTEVLGRHNAKTVLLQPAGETALSDERAADLAARLKQHGIALATETDDETLFAVDAAVTGVTAAIAETGTILCESGTNAARGTSLIPPLHVALLSASQLVADLCDCFALLEARSELPANANLITGPSKTADIEGVLVTGVHGPGHVHVVLITDL